MIFKTFYIKVAFGSNEASALAKFYLHPLRFVGSRLDCTMLSDGKRSAMPYTTTLLSAGRRSAVPYTTTLLSDGRRPAGPYTTIQLSAWRRSTGLYITRSTVTSCVKKLSTL